MGWENLQSRAVVNPGRRMGGIRPLLTAMLLLGENDVHCCIKDWLYNCASNGNIAAACLSAEAPQSRSVSKAGLRPSGVS